MMNDNREAVESAFKDGVISVLVATSTVATGVNLPAQRVIIRDNYTGRKESVLPVSRLRQMAGRAGRSGIDTKGECVCILQNTSVPALKKMRKLMTAPVCIP
jgi:replicative superfamily II helicase